MWFFGWQPRASGSATLGFGVPRLQRAWWAIATGSTVAALIAIALCTFASAEDLKLWYDKPATNWEREALPIGNGRLAAMIYGTVPEEHIQFNEESFWIGDEKDTGAYQNAGDLYVKVDHKGPVTNYRRELDIENGVHSVNYKSGGQDYERVAFASMPLNAMYFNFRADNPQSGTITLVDALASQASTQPSQTID